MQKSTHEIPKELTDLVSKSVKLLGRAIEQIYGPELYTLIEGLRLKMKGVRALDAYTVHSAMETIYHGLKNKNSQDLHKVAKAFSLMLELINSCEASYRSHRLERSQVSAQVAPSSLVYVFTSHPTEARSTKFLFIMDKVERLLEEALNTNFNHIEERLFHLLKMSLRIDLANNRRPQVKDEAEQIFHTVLDKEILQEQVELKKKGVEVYFRTWVGGDKDGHPKVGASTMLQSLNLSRTRLLNYVNVRITDFVQEVDLMNLPVTFRRRLSAVQLSLRGIARVKPSDGKRVRDFKKRLHLLIDAAERENVLSPELKDIEHLIWIYPAMVLPLEIREDHELIREALKKPSMPIAKMLAQLKRISQGLDAKWYVRGFIVSMCQTADDLIAAGQLTKKMCGSLVLPVVPLLENEKGLKSGVEILKGAFAQLDLKEEHKKKWGGRFEVMLGYSDSSKENGVLPSRLLVERALLDLETFLHKSGLTPVFFHGSGGSVSRGGGSVKEQIAWLPQSALNIYKVTVQGETVQRHFNRPAIMRSQVNKIVQEFAEYKPKKWTRPQEIIDFSSTVQSTYKDLVKDIDFQNVAMTATPYDFLNVLKIGSRPTKRTGKGKFTLRAIPWILCWTQTRLLLPIWWGVGTAWETTDNKARAVIKEHYKESPLLQSYMKNLGFTLAKVELGVWKFQLSHSGLTEEEKKRWFETMEKEVERTLGFFEDMTGSKDLTWFNHRLGESIVFRSSMIHPLNVIQRLSLERKDNVLLRETVTGIACGMLTTG
jgi:phosphoenolpyruvate carboxylase